MRSVYFLSAAALTALLATAGGCVYTVGSGLPDRIRTVGVRLFENPTGYPGLEAELARALAREFAADGRLIPAVRNADSELEGVILRVDRGVLREDEFGAALTGSVSIAARVSLTDAEGGRKLLDQVMVASDDSARSTGLYRLRRGESETEARLEAVDALAREIVRRIIEVW